MCKNCKSLFIGLTLFFFAFQVKEANAMIPLPSWDIQATVQRIRQQMELLKSYQAKVQKVLNTVKTLQNEGFAAAAGDLLYMWKSGEFDYIGQDLARFSENSATMFMSKEKLEERAKEQAEKEAAEKEKLMKEAEEKGITYEQLMIEKRREDQKNRAIKRGLITAGQAGTSALSGNSAATASYIFGSLAEFGDVQLINYEIESEQKARKDKEMKDNLDELVTSGPSGLPEMENPTLELPDKIQSLDELSAGWGGVQ